MDIPTPDFLPEAPEGLDGHGDLTPAEIALVRAALAGRECKRGDRRPEAGEDSDAIRVRAELVRFLARGGNEAYPVDPKGVDVAGARVCGELDLMACRDLRPLRLFDCHLTNAPLLLNAAGQIVSIQRCALPGLGADRLSLSGTLFLSGSEVSGCVRVSGARIGGTLDCTGAKLTGRDGDGNALVADGAEIGGSAFLSGDFEAAGCMRVSGARIGGDLACEGAKLTGRDGHGDALVADGAEIGGNAFLRKGFEAAGCVRLPGARIGGDLACVGARFGGADRQGLALFVESARVEGGFEFCRLAAPPAGIVDLNSAQVGTLADDLAAWPVPEGGTGGSRLDGFRYDRIAGLVDFGTRKAWLLRQRPDHLCEDFKPQPFEQLAKVLRETGHAEDARRIAILKREYQRRAAWAQAKARAAQAGGGRDVHLLGARMGTIPARWLELGQGALRRGVDRLFGAVAGYGYRPLYALGWFAGLVAVSSLIFAAADRHDAVIPNDPFTLRSAEWTGCVADRAGHPSRAACFLAAERRDAEGAPQAGEAIDYPPFSALGYTLDTAVPFVDLHQEALWIPDAAAGWPGFAARVWLYFHIALGWGITALFAASVTGVVKTDV